MLPEVSPRFFWLRERGTLRPEKEYHAPGTKQEGAALENSRSVKFSNESKYIPIRQWISAPKISSVFFTPKFHSFTGNIEFLWKMEFFICSQRFLLTALSSTFFQSHGSCFYTITWELHLWCRLNLDVLGIAAAFHRNHCR